MDNDDTKNDTRPVCKYGTKCYQKNPAHHTKYRHPPKRKVTNDIPVQAAKRLKVNSPVKEVVKHDLSDSEPEETEIKIESDNENKKEERKADLSDSETKNKENKTDLSEIQTEENEPNERIASPIVSFTPSNINYKDFIKEKFLVEMPDDFYQLWDLCVKLKPNAPNEVFKSVGLSLIGPYDVLAEKFCAVKEKSAEEYLTHWRYYYDPPEFQTILKDEDSKGFHAGYFRDDPKELPVFVASNCAKIDGVINVMGENIFAAIYIYLDDLKKTGDPFKKMHIGKLQLAIKDEAQNLNLDLSRKTGKMRNRENKIVSKTFNKIGLVVPYNKKTQLGYRGLAMNDKDLKALLTKLKNALPEQQDSFLSLLQPVLTYASIALDECDFGTGIELGWNLLSFGIDSLNRTISTFLDNSYSLLKRNEFGKIAIAHMKNRKKGNKLSILY